MKEIVSSALKSFIGSAITILLGILVAWIAGIGNMKEKVIEVATEQQAQKVRFTALETKIEERDKQMALIQLRSVESDGALKAQLSGFQAEHNSIINQVGRVQQLLDERRK